MASGLMIDSESRLSARFGGIRLSFEGVAQVGGRALRQCRRRARSGRAGRQRSSNRALETTITEESATAAPAIIGVGRPRAATGKPTTS